MTSPLTFSLDPASSGVSSSSEWLSKNQPRFPLDLLLDFGDICSISSLSFSISTDYLIPRRVEISALLKGKFETLGELAFRDDTNEPVSRQRQKILIEISVNTNQIKLAFLTCYFDSRNVPQQIRISRISVFGSLQPSNANTITSFATMQPRDMNYPKSANCNSHKVDEILLSLGLPVDGLVIEAEDCVKQASTRVTKSESYPEPLVVAALLTRLKSVDARLTLRLRGCVARSCFNEAMWLEAASALVRSLIDEVQTLAERYAVALRGAHWMDAALLQEFMVCLRKLSVPLLTRIEARDPLVFLGAPADDRSLQSARRPDRHSCRSRLADSSLKSSELGHDESDDECALLPIVSESVGDFSSEPSASNTRSGVSSKQLPSTSAFISASALQNTDPGMFFLGLSVSDASPNGFGNHDTLMPVAALDRFDSCDETDQNDEESKVSLSELFFGLTVLETSSFDFVRMRVESVAPLTSQTTWTALSSLALPSWHRNHVASVSRLIARQHGQIDHLELLPSLSSLLSLSSLSSSPSSPSLPCVSCRWCVCRWQPLLELFGQPLLESLYGACQRARTRSISTFSCLLTQIVARTQEVNMKSSGKTASRSETILFRAFAYVLSTVLQESYSPMFNHGVQLASILIKSLGSRVTRATLIQEVTFLLDCVLRGAIKGKEFRARGFSFVMALAADSHFGAAWVAGKLLQDIDELVASWRSSVIRLALMQQLLIAFGLENDHRSALSGQVLLRWVSPLLQHSNAHVRGAAIALVGTLRSLNIDVDATLQVLACDHMPRLESGLFSTVKNDQELRTRAGSMPTAVEVKTSHLVNRTNSASRSEITSWLKADDYIETDDSNALSGVLKWSL